MALNKQTKRRGGVVVSRGIEWTDYTYPVFGGCFHRCRWKMPDGKIAVCYAETTAESVAHSSYPQGFEHHYYRPKNIDDPRNLRRPARIFMDSMADMFGHWVPAEQIRSVLEVVRECPQHTFQSLTKNAPRLLEFAGDLPANMHVGVSTPPDFYMGKELSRHQQVAMFTVAMEVFAKLPGTVKTWLSAEPLSWDVAEVLERDILTAGDFVLDWVVIGAASNGDVHYQPQREHVERLHAWCDRNEIPVFHKGNLEWDPHREEFPE